VNAPVIRILCQLALAIAMVLVAGSPSSVAQAQDFSFAEPEFETLRDVAIDDQIVTTLAQDGRGLIWIGTQNGLIRYDGYRFRMFKHRAADPFSLAGDYIRSLLVAKDGRIWIGTLSDGISVFDPASERFEHFRHDEKVAHSLAGGIIWALADDGRGGVWVATDQGLDHLPAGASRFEHFKQGPEPHSLLDDKIRSLWYDRAGRLWVGSSSGLQRLASDGKSFETVLKGRDVLTLFQAQDGKLWLGTREHGAAWLDAAQQVHWLPLAQLSHPMILGIAQVPGAPADQIWLASFGGGIMVLAASDGRLLQTLRHDPLVPGSLAHDTIKPLLLDRAGGLWLGTWGAGLQRMSANNHLVRTLRQGTKREIRLSHRDVRSILELADGRLLIGIKGNGIDIFDRQRGWIGREQATPNQVGALPDASVSALAQSADGTIWAGTEQAGVVRQLPGSRAWVAVPGVPGKHVFRLLVGRDGSLWAGTSGGVARWHPASPARFEAIPDQQGQVMQAAVNAMVEDRHGRIWAGTANGLWLYEPGQRGLIHFPAEPGRADGLVSDYVLGLLPDRHDRLWVATDKGLERMISHDGKTAHFEHISARLGQPGLNLGENLLEDQHGRIWTPEWVIDPGKHDPATQTTQTTRTTQADGKMRMSALSRADGIHIGTTWVGSYTKMRNGLLLFGGAQGLAIIDPARFKPYQHAPPLAVSELKINGVATAPASLALPPGQVGPGSTAGLTLNPVQRNFAIEFAALDYSEPRKNRYQYRLQGYEEEWINTDSEHRTAAYGNLWPGSYTLQVRGSNRLGAWSGHELHIPIQVLPAWWQSVWFGLVLLLGSLALLAALVQVRTHYLHRRQRELEQLVGQRTSQLRQNQAELVDANHELNHANAGLVQSVETLRQLGDIGREITANLDAGLVFQTLYLYVVGLLAASKMTIYRMNASASAIDVVFGGDDDQVLPRHSVALDAIDSPVVRVVRERQELLIRLDQPGTGFGQSAPVAASGPMRTALFAPLIVGHKVWGAMAIESDQQNAWGERERLIFRTLSAWGAIAMSNADAIAALSKAQGQLVQQEKMASLGSLVAGIAHAINTPLGTTLVAISGVEKALQTLKNANTRGSLSRSILESNTEEGLEYNALALKTATRAAELIAMFKTVSVDANSDSPVEIELADYLQELASLVKTRLEQQGSQLVLSVPAGLRIHVVQEALTESLSRILLNALAHGFADGRRGTLSLTAQLEMVEGNELVVISVSDDGHGIAAQDLPRVFDPFFTTRSGLHGHVGLGLHVAYNHVTQRLKGQIHLSSHPGKGTRVEIRLKNQV
jgi:ligand-binding sensor domain-containing protein/signal transduction histidine kinase